MMKKIFCSVILSLMVVFIYWCGVYFLQGYNLTDNVAHLDIKSMLDNFNYQLENYGFNSLEFLNDNILKPLNNVWNTLLSFVDSATINVGVNSFVKFILNGINYILNFISEVVLPLNRIISVAEFLNVIIENVFGFFVGFVKFLLYPQFI